MKSEILTNVTTDTARENSGALKNNFDKDKVQSEINLQVDVTKKFDETRQGVKKELYSIVDAKREEATQLRKGNRGYDTEQATQLDNEANKLNEVIRWVDAGLGAVF